MAEPKKAGCFATSRRRSCTTGTCSSSAAPWWRAVVSGHADVVLPLVAAGELAYLAGLTTLPRFQGAIDAKARAEQRGPGAPSQPRRPKPGRGAATASSRCSSR